MGKIVLGQKPRYFGKTMEKLWYYDKNYGTIVKTMKLRFTTVTTVLQWMF